MPAAINLARRVLTWLCLCALAACSAADYPRTLLPAAALTPLPVLAVRAAAATLTPFQPVLFTPTPPLPGTPTPPAVTPAAATAPAAPTPHAPLNLWGIDFGSDRSITLQIVPADPKLNGGKPILIAFFPGSTCIFGDHHACVHSYRAASGADILFLSIHSGVGGEAQAYRHALEGTGLDQAGLTLKQIRANLQALDGAQVTLTQGERVVRGLVLALNGRVPAGQLESYFSVPIEQAVARAAAADARLKAAVNPAGPELVFETCGWKVREEPWAAGVTSTTASIYLGVIRKEP